MRIPLMIALLAAFALAPLCPAVEDKGTALKFVNEYVRELSTFNVVRVASEKELNKSSAEEGILNLINGSEKFQLELRASIEILKGFHFSHDPLDKLVPEITRVYQSKIDLWQQLSDIGSQFLAPKEGVDYGKLAAEMPKIRARMDFQDTTLLQMSPVVFMTLIDFTQKDQSKPAHLAITRAERDKLLSTLRDDFGAKLDQKGQNYEVSTAGLLKGFLLKYKCADEVTYR